jgi:hypothetical protein
MSGVNIMTARTIQKALWQHYKRYKYLFSNIYIGYFEADFVAISKAGYTYEIEIKVSRSDFFNDFKKGDKHKKYASGDIHSPNRFYFATPKGLLKLEEIPDYAGLIEINNDYFKIVKSARNLHKEKLLDKNWFTYAMMKKLYYKNQILRDQHDIMDFDVKTGQLRL